MSTRGSGARLQVFEHQEDSKTVIATPVSGTKYEWLDDNTGSGSALGTQNNVRIISIHCIVTWAVTQPTPIEIWMTLNKYSPKWYKNDPVTATPYYVNFDSDSGINTVLAGADNLPSRAFLLEDRAVKIEIELTWATTQPTDLTLNVKWAKIP